MNRLLMLFMLCLVTYVYAEQCPVDDIQRVKAGAYSCESWVKRFGVDSLGTFECMDLNRNAGILRYVYRDQPSCAQYQREIDYIWQEYNVVQKAAGEYYGKSGRTN